MICNQKGATFLQKCLKIFVILFVIIFFLGVCFFLCLFYQWRFRVTEIDMVASPDGVYTIELQQVGEPFLFSNTDTRLILKEGKKRICKLDTYICNDGGQLYPENWKLTWEEDHVVVLLDGADGDREVTIYYNGQTEERDIENRGPVIRMIDTKRSPDGEYTLTLQQIVSSMPSQTDIRLVLHKGDEFVRGVDTYYGGSDINKDAWTVIWEDDRVTVKLDDAGAVRAVIIHYSGEVVESNID